MPTNITIYKKRPGAAKDVGISTSCSGRGGSQDGTVTIHLNVREGDGLKVRLNLTPGEARSLSAGLLDGAAFAVDLACERCGHGRIAHSGGYAAGKWSHKACASKGCECGGYVIGRWPE